MIVNNASTNNMYTANRRITEVYSSTSLLNKRCFIIAGGPSLANFDFSLLKNEFTIGINRCFETYPTNILYCMDRDVYDLVLQKKLDEYSKSNSYDKFMNFQGTKVFLAIAADSPLLKYEHNCYVVNRIYSEEFNFNNLEKGIYAGSNSGMGAIMLACSMGCTEIFLCGYDMKATEKTHYHNGYPKQDITRYRERINLWRTEMFKWAPEFVKNDISITNCYINSPEDTSLNCFQVKSLKECIIV